MIRPDLFMTEILVRNFRGYGGFKLPLRGGPCVVLLSGPNGLGKTSLFEAVEWGLTGAVKRLDVVSGGKTNPRDLARRAEKVENVEVQLSFRDKNGAEERVRRLQLIPSVAHPPEPTGTPIEAVAELLRSDDVRWNLHGENLSDYLHLTHLHAQAASLRLVASSAKDRWVRVSPLAGADRFDRVRANLTNSKGVLTKLREDRSKSLLESRARRDQWIDLLRRLEHQQKIVGALRDVFTPIDVTREVTDLARRASIALDIGAENGGDALRRAVDAVLRLRAEVNKRLATGEQRIDILGRLRSLPRQMSDVTAQRSAILARQASADQRASLLSQRLEQHAGVTQALRSSASEADRLSDVARARHERVSRVFRDHEDAVRLGAELADANEQLREAERKREDAATELARTRNGLAEFEKAGADLASARRGLEAVERASAAVVELESIERRSATERARLLVLEEELRRVEAESERLAEEQRFRDEGVRAAEGVLEGHRDAAAALHSALLAIAEHTKEDDTECLVCRTRFEPGVLRALVHASVAAVDPALATAERRLDELRREQGAVQQRASSLAQDQRRARADGRAVQDSLTQLSARSAELARGVLIEGAAIADARARIAEERAIRQEQTLRLQKQLAVLPNAEQLRRALSSAAAALDLSVRLSSMAQERSLDRQARVEEVRARIEQIGTEYTELQVGAAALRRLSSSAALESSQRRDAADLATSRVAESLAEETLVRQALAAANQELTDARGEAFGLGLSLEALMNRWRKESLPEAVSESVIDSEVERVTQGSRDLASMLSELERLSAGLERWHQATELQGLEEEVREYQLAGSRESVTAGLNEAVARAEASVAVAQRARDAADELSVALGKVTAEFGDQALKPFGELFRGYLRALVHDDRFHSIAATYKHSARAASLRFRVGLGGSDTDAENILSEGQLGEVSLAAMLSAGTTFPWSRWRALLLDDPTQYNDLIHATALFDVLRNLVGFAGYQVIVSTHDNEQAAFLRRKLDAVGIQWVDCRYVAHSPDGIMADIRRSDGEVGSLASAS